MTTWQWEGQPGRDGGDEGSGPSRVRGAGGPVRQGHQARPPRQPQHLPPFSPSQDALVLGVREQVVVLQVHDSARGPQRGHSHLPGGRGGLLRAGPPPPSRLLGSRVSIAYSLFSVTGLHRCKSHSPLPVGTTAEAWIWTLGGLGALPRRSLEEQNRRSYPASKELESAFQPDPQGLLCLKCGKVASNQPRPPGQSP